MKLPEDDKNIENMTLKKFAPQSKRKIVWAVNLYNDWCRNRIGTPGCNAQIVDADLGNIGVFAKSYLAFSLMRFVREVKKIDVTEYPPNTLCELVIMIQMYLHERGLFWKLLERLRNIIDNTMKERHVEGLGVHKSSDVIRLEDEDKLFNQDILGDKIPIQLLRTMIYMMGLCIERWGGT